MSSRPEIAIESSLLARTLETMCEGLQILSPDWRYLYVNEAVARHGKKSRAELLGRTMLECYPGIERTRVFAVLESCMRERRAAELETDFVYEDGSCAWFELRIEPCPEGLVVLSLDITERKSLQAAMVKTERLRALGEMAAGVAHDLRNLLNPLSLQLQLLERRLPPDAAVRGIVDQMASVVERGVQTVDLLRDLGRHAPEAEVPAGEADLGAVAREAVVLGQARSSAIVDEVSIDAPLAVRVRPAELLSAVVNLILNAIDAVGDQGRVTVRTGIEGAHVWIEVDDDGPGMPPEVEARAFEPFFTTKGDRGTGLGLAMVYATALRHGGDVRLRTAPGKGTSVTLSFPRLAP